MKYKLTAAMVVACVSMSVSISAIAGTASSSLKITGNITESTRSTCDVDVGEGGNVQMPIVELDSFGEDAGATSAATDFNVELKNCPDFVTYASARIEGEADYQNPELLRIPRPSPDSTAYAFGFGLEFLVDGATLAVKKSSPEFAMKDGIIDIPLGVRYKATYNRQGRLAGKVSVPGQILVDYR